MIGASPRFQGSALVINDQGQSKFKLTQFGPAVQYTAVGRIPVRTQIAQGDARSRLRPVRLAPRGRLRLLCRFGVQQSRFSHVSQSVALAFDRTTCAWSWSRSSSAAVSVVGKPLVPLPERSNGRLLVSTTLPRLVALGYHLRERVRLLSAHRM